MIKENLEFARNSAERKEGAPDHIKVFRVRHGDTNYDEQFKGEVLDNQMDLKYEGMEQVEAAATRIARRLDKENDVIWVINSPIKRAVDSAGIIREYLRADGFNIWEDPKGREKQERIRAVDVFDKKGKPLKPGSKAYVEKMGELLKFLEKQVPDSMSISQYYYKHSKEIRDGENYSDIQKRSRRQLKKLSRIARMIQPKLSKRIVIVQVEHGETMNEIMKRASDGEISAEKGSGADNAEILEFTIPVKGDNCEVDFIDRKNIDPKTVSI